MNYDFSSFDTQAKITNSLTYGRWFNYLYGIAISMYKWTGLPPEIKKRYVEYWLFWRGTALFYKDDVLNEWLIFPYNAYGSLDGYGIPRKREAYANNGYRSPVLDDKNSVIIWNNYSHTNSALPILQYAEKLSALDRIIDININAQKTPIIIQCDPKSELTFKSFYKKYDGNEPVIFISKDLNSSNFKLDVANTEFVADKLQTLKRQYLLESLTILGIEANTSEKQERQVSDELTVNMGGIEASRLSFLNARQDAAEEMSTLYGKEITCEFNSSLPLSKIMAGMTMPTGGDNIE